MKGLIWILIIAAVGLGAWKLWEYWDRVSQQREAAQEKAKIVNVVPEQLNGLPPQLEPSLQQAKSHGSAGLKAWLDQYKRTGVVRDPRLAWIELDYVILISSENPFEAKRIFAEVKKRTPQNSPVSPRIKSLEKTFE